MEALKVLVTTSSGLMSIGAFGLMTLGATYLFVRLRRLMNGPPGKEGWD
jgi:hypothetical protein